MLKKLFKDYLNKLGHLLKHLDYLPLIAGIFAFSIWCFILVGNSDMDKSMLIFDRKLFCSGLNSLSPATYVMCIPAILTLILLFTVIILLVLTGINVIKKKYKLISSIIVMMFMYFIYQFIAGNKYYILSNETAYFMNETYKNGISSSYMTGFIPQFKILFFITIAILCVSLLQAFVIAIIDYTKSKKTNGLTINLRTITVTLIVLIAYSIYGLVTVSNVSSQRKTLLDNSEINSKIEAKTVTIDDVIKLKDKYDRINDYTVIDFGAIYMVDAVEFANQKCIIERTTALESIIEQYNNFEVASNLSYDDADDYLNKDLIFSFLYIGYDNSSIKEEDYMKQKCIIILILSICGTFGCVTADVILNHRKKN